MNLTVAKLAEFIGGDVDGDANVVVSGMAGLRDAGEGDVSFLANPKYAHLLEKSPASAVIVAEGCEAASTAVLIRVKDPDAAFARLAKLLGPDPVVHPAGVHPSAVVAADVELGEDVSIGPLAVISASVRIGSRTVIEAGCFIGEKASIGEDGHIYPNVTVLDRAEIGDRVIIHSGTVIGSDGFGYNTRVEDDGRVVVDKVPQVGIVSIGNDVEIGANVSVDRARFGQTRIGNCVKIDNLVQIAHNVKIGDYSGIVAHVSLAGSSEVGSRVIIWGHSAVAGHTKVGDDVQVNGMSGVTKDIAPGQIVFGLPAMPMRQTVARAAAVKQVPRLKKRIIELESRLEKLEKSLLEMDA